MINLSLKDWQYQVLLGDDPNVALLRDFSMSVPSIEEKTRDDDWRTGGTLPGYSLSNVIETGTVVLIGTPEETRSRLASINSMFEAARRITKQGTHASRFSKVTLIFQNDASDVFWESEVIDGMASIADDAMHQKYRATNMDADKSFLMITFSITRVPYWEKSVYAQVVTINLHGQSWRNSIDLSDNPNENSSNYVDIMWNDYEGDLPSPLRIEVDNPNFENITGGLRYASHVKVDAPSSGGDYTSEIGVKTSDSGHGTPIYNSSYRDGEARRVTVGTNWDTLVHWSNTSPISKVHGNHEGYKMLLFLYNAPSPNIMVYAEWKYNDQFIFQSTQKVVITGEVTDLGVVTMPPNGYILNDDSIPESPKLEIKAKSITNQDEQIDVGYVAMIPLQMYQECVEVGNETQFYYALINDMNSGEIYPDIRLGLPGYDNLQRGFTRIGDTIFSMPGRTTRIYIHPMKRSLPNISGLLTRVSYKPRRIAI